MFEAVWKLLWFCLETVPSMLELAVTKIVNILPVFYALSARYTCPYLRIVPTIVNDEIGYVDLVLSKCFDSFENLLFVETLSESIPSA